LPETTQQIVLKLEGISKTYHTGRLGSGTSLKAVQDVNLEIRRGEIFGIVGESGCGKSTVAKMVAQLMPQTSGTIYLEQEPVELRDRKKLHEYRKKVQMVFQDPYSSLNPKKTIRQSVLMPLRSLYGMSGREADARFERMMELVGLPKRLHEAYPHEMSGGQLQRAAIARALIVDPLVLIADEPIAALDVSIQSQVLNLMSDLQREIGLTILFISHDLRVVEQFTDRTAIMYLGNVVEVGETKQLFRYPDHPYTRALIRSIPRLDSDGEGHFEVLEGEVPSLYNIPQGCPFHTRCAFRTDRCLSVKPLLQPVGGEERHVACHHPLHHEAQTSGADAG